MYVFYKNPSRITCKFITNPWTIKNLDFYHEKRNNYIWNHHQVQHNQNGGKCGVCGDNYADPKPRANENTGTYGRGKIARTYIEGQVIKVSVLVTANHKGSFVFGLCNLTNPNTYETEECFEVLKQPNGEDKYVLPSTNVGYYETELKLPEGFVCERCVLRWHYDTGKFFIIV